MVVFPNFSVGGRSGIIQEVHSAGATGLCFPGIKHPPLRLLPIRTLRRNGFRVASPNVFLLLVHYATPNIHCDNHI